MLFLLADNPPPIVPASTHAAVLTHPSLTVAPPALLLPTGMPETAEPAFLIIPSAGVAARIMNVYLDGVSWDVRWLGYNVGLLQGTATFDRPGNIGLVGHVEMQGGERGIFANLHQLVEGELIIYEHGADERFYAIRSVEVTAPDDLTVLYPTATEQLTLITCDSYDFLNGVYLERIVVTAERT